MHLPSLLCFDIFENSWLIFEAIIMFLKLIYILFKILKIRLGDVKNFKKINEF